MIAAPPNRLDTARRAQTRTALIFAGVVDLALAGFFLGWGSALFKLDQSLAWLVAALLAAGGVALVFVAMLGFGRRGTGRAPGEGEDAGSPIVRR